MLALCMNSEIATSSDSEPECNICFKVPDKWHLLPCRHKLCKKCFSLLQDTKCPWCREKFKKKKKNRTRTRSYSDPFHNRDSLHTPIDVIEHEIRIERTLERKRKKKDKRSKIKIYSSEHRFLFNNVDLCHRRRPSI